MLPPSPPQTRTCRITASVLHGEIFADVGIAMVIRSSGGPSCVFAPFQDPGRADMSWPIADASMLPPLSGQRRPRRWLISGLTPAASVPAAPRLHAWQCRTRARLASSWLASRCREGVEPSGPLRKVSVRLTMIPLSCSRDVTGLRATLQRIGGSLQHGHCPISTSTQQPTGDLLCAD
jgi:hypothetical protein